MSVVGPLEDLALIELLRALHAGRRTGRITVNGREGSGSLFLQGGLVHLAGPDPVSQAMRQALLREGLFAEEALSALEEAHRQSGSSQPLCAFLVEGKHATRDALERCFRQQVERGAHELFGWRAGFFRYDPANLADPHGAAPLELRDFLLHAGLAPDDLAPGDARPPQEVTAPAKGAGTVAVMALDPRLRRRSTAPPGVAPARAAEPAPEPPPDGAGRTAEAVRTLRTLLREFHSPDACRALPSLIIRCAAGLLDRGVFFMRATDAVKGTNHFGLEANGASADERARTITIPLDQPSVFTEVLVRGTTYLGPLVKTTGNERLIQSLGGVTPPVGVAVPMTVNDDVVGIFYGDNAPTGRSIAEVDVLEILLAQAGLAMEKAMLEAKLKAIGLRRPSTV